ncbi:hypothetical protein GCM10023259_096380 [Thermocatellispora tengchongensis]
MTPRPGPPRPPGRGAGPPRAAALGGSVPWVVLTRPLGRAVYAMRYDIPLPAEEPGDRYQVRRLSRPHIDALPRGI